MRTFVLQSCMGWTGPAICFGVGQVWPGLARSKLAQPSSGQHGQSDLFGVVSGPIRDASPTVPEGMPVAKPIRHQTR